MDATKPWYESNGAWANLLQMVTGLAVTEHFLSVQQAAVVVTDAPSLIVGLVTLVLGAWGFWGRLRATKQIKLA